MQDINEGSKIEYKGKVTDKPTKETEEEMAKKEYFCSFTFPQTLEICCILF